MTNWLHQSFHRMRSLFRRAQLDRDLDEEMSAHLELAVEENLERGLSPARTSKTSVRKTTRLRVSRSTPMVYRPLPAAVSLRVSTSPQSPATSLSLSASSLFSAAPLLQRSSASTERRPSSSATVIGSAILRAPRTSPNFIWRWTEESIPLSE